MVLESRGTKGFINWFKHRISTGLPNTPAVKELDKFIDYLTVRKLNPPPRGAAGTECSGHNGPTEPERVGRNCGKLSRNGRCTNYDHSTGPFLILANVNS